MPDLLVEEEDVVLRISRVPTVPGLRSEPSGVRPFVAEGAKLVDTSNVSSTRSPHLPSWEVESQDVTETHPAGGMDTSLLRQH